MEMNKLEDRIRTRLEWGLMADVQPPDLETRMAITRNKAAQFGVVLPDEVVTFIGETVTSNIRQLEGVVKKLTAYRDLLEDDITVSSVRRAIKDVIRVGTYVPTPNVIIAETARYFSVSEEALRGQSRQKNTATARQVAMYPRHNGKNKVFHKMYVEKLFINVQNFFVPSQCGNCGKLPLKFSTFKILDFQGIHGVFHKFLLY